MPGAGGVKPETAAETEEERTGQRFRPDESMPAAAFFWGTPCKQEAYLLMGGGQPRGDRSESGADGKLKRQLNAVTRPGAGN